MAIDLWQCIVSPVEPLEVSRAMLSPEEIDRAHRFRFPADQARFVRTRAWLRRTLARYLHRSPAKIAFATSSFGKPSLAPGSDSRLRFNLTHAGEMALLAVAWDHDVGVDFEPIRGDVDFDGVAATVFSERERRCLSRSRQERRAETFFALWTRKEAVIKATGHGFALDPRQIDVAFDLSIAAPSADTHLDPGPIAWAVRSIAVAPGYAAAIAVGRASAVQVDLRRSYAIRVNSRPPPLTRAS